MHIIYYLFFACFVLTCSALAMIPPSGAASSGMASGFLYQAQFRVDGIVIILTSVMCASLQGRAWIRLPSAYLLSFFTGALTQLHQDAYSYAALGVFASALACLALSLCVRTKIEYIAFIIVASCAFHLGRYNTSYTPLLADSLYFALGQMLALLLALSLGVSITMICSKKALPHLTGSN